MPHPENCILEAFFDPNNVTVKLCVFNSIKLLFQNSSSCLQPENLESSRSKEPRYLGDAPSLTVTFSSSFIASNAWFLKYLPLHHLNHLWLTIYTIWLDPARGSKMTLGQSAAFLSQLISRGGQDSGLEPADTDLSLCLFICSTNSCFHDTPLKIAMILWYATDVAVLFQKTGQWSCRSYTVHCIFILQAEGNEADPPSCSARTSW